MNPLELELKDKYKKYNNKDMAKTDPVKILFHKKTVEKIAGDSLKVLMSLPSYNKVFHKLTYNMAPGQEERTSLEETTIHSTIYEAVPSMSTEPVAHIIFKAWYKLEYGYDSEGNPHLALPYFKIADGSLKIAYFIPCFETYPDNLESYWENNVLKKMNQVLDSIVKDPDLGMKIHVMHIGDSTKKKSTILFEPEVTGFERKVKP